MTSAASLYHSVIADVVTNCRDSFLDEAVDENVLQELKTLWENKLAQSKTLEIPPRPPPVRQPTARQQQQQAAAAANARAQLPASQQMGGPRPGPPMMPPMPQHSMPQRPMANGLDGGGPSHSQQQHVIIDPNRLMPVQITIPAQPGHPNSVPKALTVHVPAHALHQGSPASAILQQVLTQAITQALGLPDTNQAAHFLQSQINNAFRINF